MSTRPTPRLLALLAVTLWALSPGVARAAALALRDSTQKHKQTIKNTSGDSANDLHVRFRGGKVQNVKLKVGSNGIKPTSASPSQGTTTNPQTYNWDRPAPTAGDPNPAEPFSLGPKGEAEVSWEGDAKIDTKNSTWTDSGTVINNAFASAALPPAINDVSGTFVASFTNPNPFSMTYSDVQLYTSNTLADFFTDHFDTPTGDLVTGLPGSITLGAGDSMQLAFSAPVLPGTYWLALATGAPTSDPTDTYAVATAFASVPEPASLVLLGTGLLGIVCVGRRARPRLLRR